MIKTSKEQNQTLRYITDDGRVIGQFYNSWDKTYHLAEYIPYRKLPTIYLCGGRGNFSGSRSDHENLKRCPGCMEKLRDIEKAEEAASKAPVEV